MKYYIDQTFDIPWGNFDVLAEDSSKAFHVDAKLSLGHQLEIFDKAGNPVGRLVEQLEVVPTYLAWENGVHRGTIQRKLAFPKPKLVIDYKDWEISRTFNNVHFDIKDKSEKLVAKVDREKWRLKDHYVMDVVHEEDALTVLLLMLAVSAIREETRAAELSSLLF